MAVRLLALLLAFVATAAAAEPLKLRVQYAGSVPGMFGPILEAAAPLGLYRHYGDSYTIQSISIRGTGPALTALAAGEIDVAALSYEGVGNAILNAKLDIKVFADVLGTGMNGWGDDFYIARKGEMKSINDLKGRVAAVLSRGSAPDTALRHWSEKHDLKHGVDYSIVEIGIPSMLAALDAKRADLVFVVEPFTSMAERSGRYDAIFSVAQALGPTASVVWVAKGDFIANHRPAMVDFVEDHIRFRHWIFDRKNRPAALSLVSSVTKQPPEVYEDYAFTKRDHWRDRDARVDYALLQKNMEDAVALGLLKERVQLAPRYVDQSLINDALKRIK